MYDNIGEKIKGLARASFVIEAIAAVITGITMLTEASDIDDSYFILGLVIIICGPFVAWVASWILYGFGELVENSQEKKYQSQLLWSIDKNLEAIAHNMSPSKKAAPASSPVAPVKSSYSADTHRSDTEDAVNASRTENDRKIKLWNDIAARDRAFKGKCENCGSKNERLIYVEYTDAFGTARKKICFDCFCKKDCTPVSGQQ